MQSISGQVLGASQKINYFFDTLPMGSWPFVVLDIIIVSVLIYWIYLFLKETRAMRILYGLLVVLVLFLVGRLANLVLLNWLLQYLMTIFVVAIPIVFQPELRSALEKLGRSKILGDFVRKESKSSVQDEVLKAVSNLAQQNIGALIVLQRKTGLRDFFEQGTELDAKVTSDLIESIFYPKSPLHDGAMIIVGNKIVAASVTLPVSENHEESNYGFRHRAGVGITENSDAVAIIISEETGSVSLAVDGDIDRRIGADRLKNRLSSLMRKDYV